MSTSSIEKLYECYEIVNNKEEKNDSKKEAYQKILDGVNGDEKAKRLACQFISKFFKLFPDLYEVSFNKLLDLCEDDNILIRKQVIQYLPSVGKSVAEYISKIADTLTQMLVADDNTEILLIYAALNNVLKMDFNVALEAVFHQLITQLDEANELINTFAFKYLNEKLGNESDLQPEMETFIETSCQKLLLKLVGKEEYSLVIGILSYLKVNSTLIGRQKLVTEITEQTKLLATIDEPSKFLTLISNCKQATKLLSKNVHADDLLMYLLENLNDMVKLCATNTDCSLYDLLKCIVDIATRGKITDASTPISTLNLSGDNGSKCLQCVFEVALTQLPILPTELSEEAIVKLSEDRTKILLQEVSLLALYNLCKSRSLDSIMNNEHESIKEFRQKLQLLARVNQVAHKSGNDALSKVAKNDKQSEDSKEKILFSKVTNNIQILVREFFKTVPSFKTVIIPSWNVCQDVNIGTNTSATVTTVATKRAATADESVNNVAVPVTTGPANKTRLLANNNTNTTARGTGFGRRRGRRGGVRR